MLKIWFLALRPWSYTASFIPIALGAALAAGQGSFDTFMFLLTLAGGLAVHAGTNLINTYGDYVSGVDKVESAFTCPQLVTGTLRPAEVKAAGLFFFSLAAVIGLWLTWLRGWPVLAVGLTGLLGGYCYTAGISYKYKGLGAVMVFFLMGPLMTWPSYFIQTGHHSWLPIWVSLPVGFLVAAILHSNDLRDMAFDRKAGILTLALYLGLQRSMTLYYSLHVASFVCLVFLILASVLPWTAALPVLLLPATLKMFSQARSAAKGSRDAMLGLEGAAARLHFHFGLLLIAGLATQPFVQKLIS